MKAASGYWRTVATYARGQIVTLTGRIGVNSDGEKILSADGVTQGGTNLLKPLTMPSRGVGGAAFNYDSMSGEGQAAVGGAVFGLNNVGLFVRTSGRVTEVDASSREFTISDGSSRSPVEVWAPEGALPSVGQMAVVTGASSCRKTDTAIVAVVRVAGPSDISVL